MTVSRTAIRRAGPSVVAGGVLAFLLLRSAWDAGGYFPASYLATGTIALLCCGLLLAVWRPAYAISTEALVALSAIGGLALWTGLSATWSAAPPDALEGMQRNLAYVGILALGLLAAGSGRYARRILWLGFALICVICLAGLVARLLPGVLQEPASPTYRLSYPLTYWNALGCLAAMGAVLGLGVAADPRTAWHLRGLAAALAVALVTTMALSLSRGSWLALFAGTAALVVLGANRGSLLLTGIVVGLGSAASVGRLQAYPALTDDPSAGSGQVAAGHAFGLTLLLILLAVGVATSLIAVARSSDLMGRNVQRVMRPVMIGATVLLVAVLALGYAARAANVEGSVADASDRASTWVSKQWDDFMAPTSYVTTNGLGRVTSGSGGSRGDVYRVALGAFADHPFGGAGGGSFRVRWAAERPVGEQVLNAHSLEVETLSELGIVGALLLAAFLGAIGWAIVRSRLRPGGLPRSQTAAVGAAFTVWAVHSAFDWDWQMTTVTGIALLLACAVFPEGRWRRPRSASAG